MIALIRSVLLVADAEVHALVIADMFQIQLRPLHRHVLIAVQVNVLVVLEHVKKPAVIPVRENVKVDVKVLVRVDVPVVARVNVKVDVRRYVPHSAEEHVNLLVLVVIVDVVQLVITFVTMLRLHLLHQNPVRVVNVDKLVTMHVLTLVKDPVLMAQTLK